MAGTDTGAGRVLAAGVQESNGLTARWLRALDEAPSVLSGAGAWPLLAVLSAGAAGAAREELAAATGVDPDRALDVVGAYAALLESSACTRFSTGLWSSPRITVRPEWSGRLPEAWFGRLTGDLDADKAALDAWAAERTLGLIPRMPIELTPETVLVLATALAVRTRWASPFEDAAYQPTGGAWRTDRPWLGLRRDTGDLGALRVVDGVTIVAVEGQDDVDVHLVLGEAASAPAEVLAAGIAAVGREGTGEYGPGVSVHAEPSFESDPAPVLRLNTVAFDVSADHDLLRHPGVFGLATALTRGAHFPGVSADPLEISDAAQAATATFSARGFEAAAVTVAGMRCTGMLMPQGAERRVVRVDVDRPFGYLAVHRPSGLVLVAGWVREPKRFQISR
ncbi:hypothetical protein Afil01_34980 [Actinorhabdospora filicis]|uniref:Serpin domain-containing protein n=1 Tax=Actinorhabdospora filicis TaxID=1785913 RepID=A0A9W6SMQ4_9ACTN|nr:serpin family protein [Actinorhabdospora filicis]GLZ78691.1 hypothetical protein Afil01_34980 [Actinorhabdospora filicis]